MNRQAKRFTLITFDLFIFLFAHTVSYIFFNELVAITLRSFVIHLAFVMLTYIVLGTTIKIFDKINRFTSIRETLTHALLVTVTYIIATVLYEILGDGKSFRLVALSYLMAVIMIPLSRVAWRLITEHRLKREHNHNHETNTQPIRTLIIGAGSAGAIFVRSIRLRSDIQLVGFLDDDKDKQGTTIYGYPVIGKIEDLEDAVERYGVEQITIAIPSLSNDEMKDIVKEARKTNVKTNQMPYIEEVLSGDYSLDEFKEIEVSDILGRDEVELDTQVIGKQVVGKTVLVSGAGGSIGSEIVRQVARFSPAKIILLGHGEFSIYKIEKEIRQFPDRTFEVQPVIADIQDRERIFEVMETYQPDIVYHAAAHKHVPLMEANPREAVKTIFSVQKT